MPTFLMRHLKPASVRFDEPNHIEMQLLTAPAPALSADRPTDIPAVMVSETSE